MSYVRHRYGICSIAFDGYSRRPSLKDHEYKRRTGKASADIQISPEMNAHRNQQLFLANEKNNVQFINLLSHYLRLDGHAMIQSKGDADSQIVSAAIALASDGKHTAVIADDTDILVLLLCHWNAFMADIHLWSERKKAHKILLKLVDIREAAKHSVQTVLPHILPTHAWGGCDTTSAVFGHGKCRIVKLAQQSQEVRQWCAVFAQEDTTRGAVGEPGERIFISMYGGKPDDSLTKLRHARYREIAATNSSVLRQERLPPTERAAFQHSLRVHLQVMIWKSLNVVHMEPCSWMVRGEWQIVPCHDRHGACPQ